MRIIAGKYKGKKLKEFELLSTRPTSDLIRGAVFNMLGQKVVNSTFLDLFSGTGAMGIEAMSRGAKQAVFVDFNKQAIDIIKNNLSMLGDENYLLFNESYDEVLKKISKVDIVYLDPPYLSNYAEKAIAIICQNDILSSDGLVLWEHDEQKLKLLPENITTKKYGKKYVSIFKKDDLKIFINMQNNV